MNRDLDDVLLVTAVFGNYQYIERARNKEKSVYIPFISIVSIIRF